MSNPDPALAEGYEHLTYQEVTDRLSACGVKQISISFDEELQDDVIQIGDTDLSDSQLRCIVHATHKTFYNVELQGPFLGSYYEIREELAWPETKARLEAFFAERPHLGPPPQRIDGESDDDLAQRIELFCGPKAKGAFTREFGALTISMEWAGMPGDYSDMPHEELGCLLSAATLAGLPIVLIGNEKLRSEPDILD